MHCDPGRPVDPIPHQLGRGPIDRISSDQLRLMWLSVLHTPLLWQAIYALVTLVRFLVRTWAFL